mgnify:CR=1 FL=1
MTNKQHCSNLFSNGNYIQYYHSSAVGEWNNYTSKPVPMCGCDGVLPLDGRYSYASCIMHGHEHASKSIQRKSITGFTVVKHGHEGPYIPVQPVQVSKPVPCNSNDYAGMPTVLEG